MFNEQEKLELERFASNEIMLQAVKKAILAPIYQEGVLKAGEPAGDPGMNFALNKVWLALQADAHITDEMLGQNLRADAQALRHIELAFREIEKYKPVVIETKKETNNAR